MTGQGRRGCAPAIAAALLAILTAIAYGAAHAPQNQPPATTQQPETRP